MSKDKADHLVQIQEKVDRLLAQLRQDRQEIAPCRKLDAAAAAEGIAAVDAVMATLEKTSAAVQRAMTQKGR